MSSLKNSQFGKRLRALRGTGDENSPSRKRRRLNLNPSSPPTSPKKKSKALSTAVLDVTNTPTKRRKTRCSTLGEDRFVLSRDHSDLWASYSLDEQVHHPSPSVKPTVRRWSLPNPIKERADELFKSVLRSASSPIASHPLSRTSQSENSPSRLDNPTAGSYHVSPLHQETRTLMNQPSPDIRQVLEYPIRVLDAPGLSHDFYTNLIDWSPSGALAVGLEQHVYLWLGDRYPGGARLCSVRDSDDEYTALAWAKTGSTLATGTGEGHLEIYDASTFRLLRRYKHAHSNRIGTLSWTSDTLTTGSRDRTVKHWDFRDPTSKPLKSFTAHTQEVCGVKWSGDGGMHSSMLATGGNDNRMFIWDLRGSTRDSTSSASSSRTLMVGKDGTTEITPVYRFRQHKAAVKGLAWNPHAKNVLASGAGQQDACIRLWNTSTGTMINEIRTGSQVCNLLWSTNTYELVSTHGYSTQTVPNLIRIWKYPSMSLVTSLAGHTDCVQHATLNPQGDTIVTGAGDETLRFWNIFPGKGHTTKSGDSMLDYGKLIR
ncbi:WD40 repeat-like protein [Lentinula raphanica]|uniref:WD40 repeat-like protein n=1 Tax=Lentinula raphanica TaxID=153919 RepID=A0AA38P521_9AGAR|nr:WD40 repeat-like protein [Lentinula raphanica]KAJ3836449.1 WD40 repeat-like protein [Lentinula raphanica]